MKIIVKEIGKPMEVVEADCSYFGEVVSLIDDADMIMNINFGINGFDLICSDYNFSNSKQPALNYLQELPEYPYVMPVYGTAIYCYYEWDEQDEEDEEYDIGEADIRNVEAEQVSIVEKMLDADKQKELGEMFLNLYS